MPAPGAAAAQETVSQSLVRIRRDVAAARAPADTGLLTQIVDHLGTVVSRAVAYLDEIAKRTGTDVDTADLGRLAAEAAQWMSLQSGHLGIWYPCATARPTSEPNAEIEVLFCTERGRMPKQGVYLTDAHGLGRWEIYSALQDHLLDYTGPPPVLWSFAPMKPPQAYWHTFAAPTDPPFQYGKDRFSAALAADLAAAGLDLSAETLGALPSVRRLLRENEQIRNAYLRTAEALGVPANGHAPAARARAITGSDRTGTEPA